MSDAHRFGVVIVDDHPLFRQGLRQVIAADERFELLGECENGRDALALILALQPDLAVLDISLPDITGLDIARQLRAKNCSTHVAILTMAKEEQAFTQAIGLGVLGYVLKENAVSEIIRCIEAVARGEPYLSPSLSGFVVRQRERTARLESAQPSLGDLTVAERRVLRRIAENRTTKEIAAELRVSPRTVESHRAQICSKLSLRGVNSLLRFALEHRDALSTMN